MATREYMVAPPVAVVGPVGLERVLRVRHKRMLAPYLNDWLRWAGITHVERITHRPNLAVNDPEPGRQAAHAAARDAAKTLTAAAA